MVDKQTPAPPSGGSSGLDPKIAGLIAYLFGWLSGLIIFLIEKDNKEVRFHALQSIAFNVAFVGVEIILGIVLGIFSSIVFAINVNLGLLVGSLISLAYAIVGIAALVLWIMLMVKAYNEEHYKLPVLGDIVEKYV